MNTVMEAPRQAHPIPLALATISQLRCFGECPRKEHYAYQVGARRRLTDDDPRAYGTLAHRLVEEWWKTRGDLDVCLGALAAFVTIDPYVAAKARAFIVGYHHRWFAELAHLEVIAVEQRFEMPLRNPETGRESRTFRVGGKIDVIVRYDGTDPRSLREPGVYVIEHKSSSEDIDAGSPYWVKLKLDGQVSLYLDGAATITGEPVQGCIYDVFRRPAQRPTQIPLVDEDGVKIVRDGAGQRVRTKDGKKWRQTADAEAGYVLQVRPETPEEFFARIADAIAEKPDDYFRRGDVLRLEEELDEFRFDFWQRARVMREAHLASRAPRIVESCFKFNRPCDFLPVCTGEASIDDSFLYERITTQHPELRD